jgi:hypothetical protein
MAFNLLVELSLDTPDWTGLNKKLVEYSDMGIEFFPIPGIDVSSRNYLGMSVIGGEMTDERIIAFREVIFYLLEFGFPIFELYSSSQVSKENIDLLIRNFLIRKTN